MITEDGYSKDPNIIPEGIAVTFGKDMINEQGGLKTFLAGFTWDMQQEGGYWMHKMKNRPQYDIAIVYIIIANRLAYKCFYGDHHKFNTPGYSADGVQKLIDWPGIILAGPLTKCPFKRTLKGFQGFRYTTKLF
ncbi:MAG: hypothetical protein ABL876_17120 [Chitinophagaceae bacterium]